MQYEDELGILAWTLVLLIVFGFVLFVGWLILRILYRAAYPAKPARCPHCRGELDI